jgi:hypothetical protein
MSLSLWFRIEVRMPAINSNASVRAAFTDFAEECQMFSGAPDSRYSGLIEASS